MLTPKERERFWSKVDVRGPDECWLWTRGLSSTGYGKFWLRGRHRKAHQISWMAANGPIPCGKQVNHTCHVKACCNPNHLYSGTHANNMEDRNRAGRQARLSGESNGGAKLSVADVLKIRAARGRSQRQLAQEFGVSKQQISRILSVKNWTHLTSAKTPPTPLPAFSSEAHPRTVGSRDQPVL